MLPPDPDPDLGPDARPSDYPDADDWDDVPPASDGDPCCAMDEPILIEDGVRLVIRPAIAWGPGRWGLLVGTRFEGDGAQIFELAADGHPLGPPTVLDTATDPRGGAAPDRGVIRWAEGRWAVGLALRGDPEAYSWSGRLYDAYLRPASEWQPLVTSARTLFDLARLSHGDRWVGVGQLGGAFSVAAFSESRPVTVVEHGLAACQTLDAVGMRSRVAALIGGLTSGSDGNAVVVLGAEPGLDVLGTVALSSRGAERASLTAVRDVVLAATVLDGAVTVETIDPFAMNEASPAQTLGFVPRDTTLGQRTIDAIGSSKLGLAGVCYGGATGPEDPPENVVLDFAVVGPDGARRGTAVRVTDDNFLAGVANCTVGTDDEGFLVAWWTGQRLWVRRIHLRD